MAILAKNPNVGVEYRSIYKNEITRRGSYFGKDAADFLNGINIAVGLGWLSPLTVEEASTVQQPRRLTEAEHQILRDDMESLLQTRVECREFISNLLFTVAVNTQRPLYSHKFISSPIEIFDEITKQKGVVLNPAIESSFEAWGSLGGEGNASIVVKRILFAGNSFVRGLPMLHESVHFAAGPGVFLDSELSIAAYQVGWFLGYTVTPPPQITDRYVNSRYWDDLLFRACHPY